jgi:murein DD-endopeptidase MepM/ murein hydrolase activator NlpD
MTLRSHCAPGRSGREIRRRRLLALGLAVASVSLIFGLAGRGSDATPVDGSRALARSMHQWEAAAPDTARDDGNAAAARTRTIAPLPESWAGAPNVRLRYSRSLAIAPPPDDGREPERAAPVLQEHEMIVRPGDSLYTLFKSRGFARKDLAAIVAAGKSTSGLSRLRPGDRITVYTDMANGVQGLTHERARGERLNVARVDGRFRAGVAARPANAVTVSAAAVNSNDWIEWHKPTPSLKRRSVAVGNGDSLYTIFKRNGFPLAELDAIVKANDDTRQLTRLMPGQRLEFHFTTQSSISKLVHYLDDTRTLHVRRNGVGYDSKFIDVPLDRHLASAAGTIDASLFLAGQRAGLSNKVIMQLVEIFGWDVDFALDIRKGDRFALVYEELYKDGEKLRDGNILAAVFTNQGRSTRIVRYEYPDGRGAYFTPEGVSIRKAFLRSPVNYARITSRFSLSRKHPKLHKFRAHRGVDYAASRGTPIKASGDGKVDFIGRKGGYGKTIVLRHGATYTTLYAHMSRFARGLRRGKRVSQGQTIGYIGSTGLATGPHLHYEFRVRGVHRNPLRVKLPTAAPIEKQYEQDFLAKTRDMVARLELVSNPTLAADERRLTDND